MFVEENNLMIQKEIIIIIVHESCKTASHLFKIKNITREDTY